MPPQHAGYMFSSPDAALTALLRTVSPVGTERVRLERALGRVLAEQIATDRPSPACDVSAMDGYAVRLADVTSGRLRIAGEARIGRPRISMLPGAAARIVTGAPVPLQADAVIRREDVAEHPEYIDIAPSAAKALKPGEAIRRRGENAAAGRSVLSPGVVLESPQVGLLAGVGAASPLVYRRVRVAILVTGDELLGVDATPSEWQLRDSNGPALAAMVGVLPYAETLTRRHAADDLEQTIVAVRDASADADIVIITGGVSMGDRDFVPAALDAVGARTLFHRLPQRPGKPILAAQLPGGAPVLALPGNPVSVLVTARRLGAPLMRKLAGFSHPLDVPRAVSLENADEKRIDLWWHRPVKLTESGGAALAPNMGSGDFIGVAASDGFVEIPPGEAGGGPWLMFAWRI